MATIDDIAALGYETNSPMHGVYYVSGFGIAVYLAADDTATMTSIADPAADTERKFQFNRPDAAAARRALVAAGYTVTRPDATADKFTVVGGTVNLTGQTADDLVSLASSVKAAAPANN